MSVRSFKLFINIGFILLLVPELISAQSVQFIITGKKNKPVKEVSISFDGNSCGSDSLAVLSGQKYQFNCFPEGIVPVHIEAKGYELKTILLNKQHAGKPISVNLLKKGWQTIKHDEATYKFWKLKNVLYVKEKDDESIYRLGLLLDSLGLFESPYYGQDYYEHENGQDFSAFDSPVLEFLRGHQLTFIVEPVILLFRELKDGEKKFQTVNKLLPIPNVIEFGKNQTPPENVLKQFCLEKHWIYANQVGGKSPHAYRTGNPGTGLSILDIIEALQKTYPELTPTIFDAADWYSLDFNIIPEEETENTEEEEY